MKLLQYRIWCLEDSKWEYVWLQEGSPLPATCPTNTAHEVNDDSVSIVNIVDSALSTDDQGSVKITESPRSGSRKTIISHNFCDKTSWYRESTRIVGDGYGEILVPSDGYQAFQSENTYWVDIKHGKIFGEDLISTSYEVLVTVDGSPQVEDQDYSIFYEDGYINFNQAQSDTAEVRAIYSKAGSSVFTISPDPGKKLRVLYTEIQFDTSGNINSPINFQGFGYNPYDLPNKIAYGARERYKSAKDLLGVANGGQSVPAFGELNFPTVVLPFNYVATTDLKASQGAEVRIWIDNDIQLEGAFGTMTAYCLSENE